MSRWGGRSSDKAGARDFAQDMFVGESKTWKQEASKLRRSADADRRGSGRQPEPGKAHGVPNEFSFKSAALQEALADFCEQMSAVEGPNISENGRQQLKAKHRELRAKFGV